MKSVMSVLVLLAAVVFLGASPGLAETEIFTVNAGSVHFSLTNADEELTVAGGDDNEVLYSYVVDSVEVSGSVTGITKDVRINTKGGDDIIHIGDGLHVGRDLIILTGGGHDLVFNSIFEFASVAGDLSIKTGSGDDLVDLAGVTIVDHNTTVLTSTGHDGVGLGGCPPDVQTFETGEKLTIRTGSGNDGVSTCIVFVGLPYDNAFATINTGSGDDGFLSQGSQFSDGLRLTMAGGVDHALILDSFITGPTDIRLGARNDLLEVSNSTFLGGVLHGNSGSGDEFESIGNSLAADLKILGFESIVVFP